MQHIAAASDSAAASISDSVASESSSSDPSAPASEFGYLAASFADIILGTDPRSLRLNAAYRAARIKARRMLTVGLIAILVGIVAVGYPFVLRMRSDAESHAVVSQSEQTVAGWPYPRAEEELKAAHDYNARLAASNNRVLGEAVDPFSSAPGVTSTSTAGATASGKDAEYQGLINTGDGVMGTVRIPKISVALPIYHGTSDSALAAGSGHLYGTSLPVGGPSTHAVLTGHRGLVQAMMFTRLDELGVGDTFYIDVLGQELGYRVDRVTVIEPNDLSQFAIKPGEDRVTLMTCTPYGVNTHRLLVSGVRAAIPAAIPSAGDAAKDWRSIAMWAAVAATAAGVVAVLVIRRRNRRLRMLHWRGLTHAANGGELPRG